MPVNLAAARAGPAGPGTTRDAPRAAIRRGARRESGERAIARVGKPRTGRPWPKAEALLLGLSVTLPLALFSLAAWQGYGNTLRDAELRVDRTTRVLQEHANKVLETHRLAIAVVNQRLRTLDWSDGEQVRSLHDLLAGLGSDYPQIATISVVDADGKLVSSSRTWPVIEGVGFSDRDWFRHLRDGAYPPTYVSRPYEGRTSRIPVFNVAGRADDGHPGFSGAVAVSVDRDYFRKFYRGVEPSYDHMILLVREDGYVLASENDLRMDALPAGSPFRRAIANTTQGMFVGRSPSDGIKRIFAYRKVDGFPVYVGFGVSRDAALATWWGDVATYGFVALFAACALSLLSVFVAHRTRSERHALEGWRDTAAKLREEGARRQVIEEQLRQSQKMEAVGRLTGGVAHDFNNVLTIVLGSLDLLRNRLPDPEPRIRRPIENAIAGATRAAALTDRLMAFSRQQPLAPQAVDADALVSGMTGLIGRTLGEQWVLETEPTNGLWTTTADPNQLESALLNLAVNARDAMPDGGAITVSTANVAVDDGLVPDLPSGDYVAVDVTDRGTGMDPETAARAFDPFFTTKPLGQGTGLGLSQVYGFARQSGGAATLRSMPGRGTTVRILLPRRHGPAPVEEAAAETAREPAAGTTAPGFGKLLVVEDEPLVRELTANALREGGYEVIEAGTPEEALHAIGTQAGIALVLADVILGPGMNGRDLAEAARAVRPDLRFLYLTGYSKDALVHDGKLDEGVHVLTKPYHPKALLAKVADLAATPLPESTCANG